MWLRVLTPFHSAYQSTKCWLVLYVPDSSHRSVRRISAAAAILINSIPTFPLFAHRTTPINLGRRVLIRCRRNWTVSPSCTGKAVSNWQPSTVRSVTVPSPSRAPHNSVTLHVIAFRTWECRTTSLRGRYVFGTSNVFAEVGDVDGAKIHSAGYVHRAGHNPFRAELAVRA